MEKTMKRATIFTLITCLAILSLPSISSRAQVRELAENKGAAAAWGALLRLRTSATVLHTTAHPDDEDAALLTWLARNQGAYTAMLTLNRGEGGANLIGPELYDALGILRTEELLAAGRYYGLDEQLFTRVADFGFSKRLDETLEHWGKDAALDDVVRAIRKTRPDVIVSRFHGSPRDGHGNHQAAGLLTREAFKLAADPSAFPEQISKEFLSPWQAKKLYLSCRENEPYTLKIDTGAYDPLLGQTYRELASVGYGMHRSQSVGRARPAHGQSFSYLRLVESVAPKVDNEKSIFDGLDTSIVGIGAGNQAAQETLRIVQDQVETAIRDFDARKPWLIVRHLVEGARQLRGITKTYYQHSMKSGDKTYPLIIHKAVRLDLELNEAVDKALGLEMEALVGPPEAAGGDGRSAPVPPESLQVATRGQRFTVNVSIINRSEIPIETNSLNVFPDRWIGGPGLEMSITHGASNQGVNNWVQRVGPNEITSRKFQIQVPDRQEYTQPYWSRASELRDHIYQVGLIGRLYLAMPFTAPEPVGVATYQIAGVNFRLASPVMTTFIQPPFGEQRRLLNVVPAINISVSPRMGVAPIGAGQTSFTVSVSVSNNVKGGAEGKVKLKLPNDWSSTPPVQDFKFASAGEAGVFTFKVSAPGVATGRDYQIPWGDEQRFAPRPGAHRRPDPLFVIDQRRVGAEDALGLLELSDEPALGTANGGPVQQDTDVGRKPEAPRMGVSLAVEQHDIRLYGEAGAGGKHRRSFPEGEQPRDVGKDDRFPGDRRLDHLQCRERQGDDRRAGYRFSAILDIGVVDPGDDLDVVKRDAVA
jgi:LmbE family N-acetylglucosaminyl deacetylase